MPPKSHMVRLVLCSHLVHFISFKNSFRFDRCEKTQPSIIIYVGGKRERKNGSSSFIARVFPLPLVHSTLRFDAVYVSSRLFRFF